MTPETDHESAGQRGLNLFVLQPAGWLATAMEDLPSLVIKGRECVSPHLRIRPRGRAHDGGLWRQGDGAQSQPAPASLRRVHRALDLPHRRPGAAHAHEARRAGRGRAHRPDLGQRGTVRGCLAGASGDQGRGDRGRAERGRADQGRSVRRPSARGQRPADRQRPGPRGRRHRQPPRASGRPSTWPFPATTPFPPPRWSGGWTAWARPSWRLFGGTRAARGVDARSSIASLRSEGSLVPRRSPALAGSPIAGGSRERRRRAPLHRSDRFPTSPWPATSAWSERGGTRRSPRGAGALPCADRPGHPSARRRRLRG